MSPRPVTEIRVDAAGNETHESWLLIRANRASTMGGRTRLFGSEVGHHNLVVVTVTRCLRRRDLNADRYHNAETLIELEMSMAQWGAFVSSFGEGVGGPATLSFLLGEGHVARPPDESRLAESTAEVRSAGDKALREIQEAFKRTEAAFETGKRTPLRAALRDLKFKIANAPSNMEFAATSLSKHVEDVVTKARADIEAMVETAQQRGLPAVEHPLLPEAVDRDPRAALADHERPGDRG